MNSNLDVWAIQTLPEELITALNNIKKDNDILLYTNLLCHFKIGNEDIASKQFDTILYSEENDLLVMLMRGGMATADDIRKYLDNKNLKYNEVVFAPDVSDYIDDCSIPELWFAREKYVLDDAIADSINRNSERKCLYYPFLTGSLDLNYLTGSTNKECKVEGRLFQGVIRLDDKLILIIRQNDLRNITADDVNNVLKKYDFSCEVLGNSEFNLSDIRNSSYTRKI